MTQLGAPMVSPGGSVYVEAVVSTYTFSLLAPCAFDSEEAVSWDDRLELLQISPGGGYNWSILHEDQGQSSQISNLVSHPAYAVGEVIPDGESGLLASWTYQQVPEDDMAGGTPTAPKAMMEHVTPSGQSEFTMPLLPADVYSPVDYGPDYFTPPPDQALLLGENGVAFETDGSSTVSFNIADGSVNWTGPGAETCIGQVLYCGLTANTIIAATQGNGLVLSEPTYNGTTWGQQIVQYDGTGQVIAQTDPTIFTLEQPEYYSNGVWLGTTADSGITGMIGFADPLALGPWPLPPGNRNNQRAYRRPEMAHFVPFDPGGSTYTATAFKEAMLYHVPAAQALHRFFLNSQATIAAFREELDSPIDVVAFVGHSFDLALQPPLSGTIAAGLRFYGPDASNPPALVRYPLPDIVWTPPENTVPEPKLSTEARIIFVATCFAGADFQGWWDISAATTGRALIVAQSPTGQVDLYHAAVAWETMAKQLASGRDVSDAVAYTDAYVAQLGYAETWTVIGDGTVRIN